MAEVKGPITYTALMAVRHLVDQSDYDQIFALLAAKDRRIEALEQESANWKKLYLELTKRSGLDEE